MKTNIDVDTAPGGYSVLVTSIDGRLLKLHFGTAQRAGEVAKFLIEAISQERLDTIDEAHKRVIDVLDKVAGAAA